LVSRSVASTVLSMPTRLLPDVPAPVGHRTTL
jgi:hypothetical protein